MRKYAGIVVLLMAAAAAGVLLLRAKPAEHSGTVEEIRAGPFSVVSTYEGTIESRQTESIMSRLGVATVAWIAPEGAAVRKGDTVVEFSTTDLQKALLKLEQDFSRAESELESLEKAKQPLEIRELELAVLEKKTLVDGEKQYLVDTEQLAAQGLMSKEQVGDQAVRVNRAEEDWKSAEMKLQLSKEHLHPAALRQARSAVAGAERALNQGRQDLEDSSIKAPSDGIVAYKPVHVGAEFRTVRVGDSVYQNQPFMVVPDMSNLVMHCYVPEAELSRVAEGDAVLVTPLPYPGMTLSGKVESIGSMAQPVSWRPNWQKFFHVTIALAGNDPCIRPGMSAYAHVQSYSAPAAVLVSRAAVSWRAAGPCVRVCNGAGRAETREVVLGKSNETHYEVISGLKPGDKVVAR